MYDVDSRGFSAGMIYVAKLYRDKIFEGMVTRLLRAPYVPDGMM